MNDEAYSIESDDIRDEILFLMQKSGYDVEVTDDGSLYFPEAAVVCVFEDA